MKNGKVRIGIGVALLAVLLVFTSCEDPMLASSAVTRGGASFLVKDQADGGTTIQDGVLTYSTGHYLEGEPLQTGVDPFGYNYQAHLFSGSYANAYLGRDGFPPYEGDDAAYLAANPGAAGKWYWPYRDTQLAMKWNDAWLSNQDRDGDGLLDRHYGYPSYIGSSAWLTNHMRGEDAVDLWTYFTKIVAAPSDATKMNQVWYTAEGGEIGPDIWGEFATIQKVESGAGATYVSPVGPGFGKF